MQLWRRGIDDTFMTELKPAKLPKGCSFFVVFDKYASGIVTDLASEKVMEQLVDVMTTDVFPDGKAEDAEPNKICKTIRDALMNLDEMISAISKNSNSSDCTAIATLITPTHIIVVNAGDPRCVLAKAGHTVAMSFDHNPTYLGKRKRIENADGDLLDNRVNEDLSVSRALGDFIHESCVNLPAEQHEVSAETDLKVHKIDKTEEFLVLGIWDVVSNAEVCAYIRQLMNKGKTDLYLIADEILDDNRLCARIVVIVKFPGAKVGESGGVVSIREGRARLDRLNERE